MKKALPILFVASTAFITAASLTVATNGSYTQLKAADNSVGYTITFNQNDVVSSGSHGYVETFTLNKKTQSGFDFGCEASISLEDGDVFYKTGSIVEVYNGVDSSISMTFEFHNVLSAVSVTLNGYFDATGKHSYTFTEPEQLSEGFSITASVSDQTSFTIDTIVVQYTCSY